jgi:hypothetical protein
MLESTGFCAPGKDLVIAFMTKAYWAAMGSVLEGSVMERGGEVARQIGACGRGGKQAVSGLPANEVTTRW